MKKLRYYIILTTLFFLVISTSSVWPEALQLVKPETVGLSSQRLQRIGNAVKLEIKKGNIPGAVVLVARKGKVAYFETFGTRDSDKKSPMGKDAIFRIYSMSKPIVSVAAMILQEEGKLYLADPVSKYLPELGKLNVAVEGADPKTGEPAVINTVPSRRDMTVQDLLRHTSGMTYGIFGRSGVKSMYLKAGVETNDQTLDEMVAKLGKLPLAYQPGAQWEYSRSTDVLGKVIEVASGMTLDRFIETRILRPLRMESTGFYVKEGKFSRLAEGVKDPRTGRAQPLLDVAKLPKFLSGGGGMVATAMDYARFAQMMLNRGQLDGIRIISRKSVELMTADHLGSAISPSSAFFGSGYSFGLGFAVRQQTGVSPRYGSPGDFNWGGFAGTYFWVDPKEQLIAVFMIQDMVRGPLNYYIPIVRSMVYQAIID